MIPADPGIDRHIRTRAISRRQLLIATGSTGSVLLLAACGGATSPAAPTAAPAKPTEAPKPADKPTEAAKPAEAKPAAPAAPAPAASPAAAAPTQAAPAAKPATPNLRGVNLSVMQWQSFIPDADPSSRSSSKRAS